MQLEHTAKTRAPFDAVSSPRPTGQPEDEPTPVHRLRTIVCTESYSAAHQIASADVEIVVPDERDLLWLDLEAPSAEELKAVGDEFGFHPLAIEDATQEHQRAKIDRYEHFSLIVLFAVTYHARGHRIEEHELDVFMGDNYLITVHHGPIEAVNRTAGRLRTDLGTLTSGVAVLLYALADTLVDAYLPIADAIRDRIQQLERRVFAMNHPRLRPGVHEDIFSLRSELLQLRHVISPERGVLGFLARRRVAVVDKKTAPYFQDVADHLERVVETIDVYLEMLASVLESFGAQTEAALSKVMRVLTAWSIILIR